MAQGQIEVTDARREDLHAIFLLLTPYVYFQAPSNNLMSYPCIRYKLDDEWKIYANNHPYITKNRYQVTVIDLDPDSVLRQMISGLPLCEFDRHYPADDLNHFVFNLYF